MQIIFINVQFNYVKNSNIYVFLVEYDILEMNYCLNFWKIKRMIKNAEYKIMYKENKLKVTANNN